MQNLFLFLRKTFPFFLFLFLEGVAIFFTVQQNKFQRAYWNNSSASFYSYVFGIKRSITDYFGLKKVNLSLAQENEMLRNKLSSGSEKDTLIDSSGLFFKGDTSVAYYNPKSGFEYMLARVVGNSSNQKYNYITLDKGKNQGVVGGMGVVDRNGVIGMTMASSKDNSLVISLLNIKASLSVRHKKSGGVGMMRWEGKEDNIFSVTHVNKNFEIKAGDTIVTSGYSSYFPPDYPVGLVVNTEILEASSFQKLEIRTFNNIGDAEYVYVIINKNKEPIDSLKNLIK